MALDVWFIENVKDHLVSTMVMAVCSHVANGSGNKEYLRGCVDACRGLAVAHGVKWPDVKQDVCDNLIPAHQTVFDEALAPRAGLLWAETPHEP
jgi:hypothetical protein